MNKFIPISPTSLSTMNTCPRKFQAAYVTKEVEFKDTPATIWGTRAHKAMEDRIKFGTPVPDEFHFIQPVVDRILAKGGEVMSETKLAIDREENPCEWTERYMGGIADVVVLRGSHAFIGDLKTGKFRPDNLQLNILTRCLYAAHPEVKSISAALFYPHIGKVHALKSTRESVNYEELIADVRHYEAVIERGEYKPNPNGLCRNWCEVTACPHNGKFKR